MVICLLAMCLGLGRVDPLWGIAAAMVWTPALMRTAERVEHLRRQGSRPNNGEKLRIFAASLGLVVAAGGSTVGAAIALAALACVIEAPWLPVVAATWGLVLGLLAGACCGLLVVQRWWRAEAAAA